MNTHKRFSCRPSDLVPWADPYIARLVEKLQDEVRDERGHSPNMSNSSQTLQAELDPPSPATDGDPDWSEESRWTLCDDSFGDLRE